MRVVDEPMETLHLYVVPENQLPPNGDHLAIFMMIFCSLFLIGIIVLSVLAPAPDHNVEFPLAIEGYSLPPVSKTVKITTIATGKQYVPGKYEHAVDQAPDPDEWFHVKIVLKGSHVSVYVNNAQGPSLEVDRISRSTHGGLGLWVGNNSPGRANHSANVRTDKRPRSCCGPRLSWKYTSR